MSVVIGDKVTVTIEGPNFIRGCLRHFRLWAGQTLTLEGEIAGESADEWAVRLNAPLCGMRNIRVPKERVAVRR
jgi:hypothetical protein